jgi:hypothetical protein
MGNFRHFLAYSVFGTMPGGLSARSYTTATTKDAESGRLRPPRRRLSLGLEQEQGADDIRMHRCCGNSSGYSVVQRTGTGEDCASRLVHARSRRLSGWSSVWLWGSMYELISICGGDMRIHTCPRVAAESAHKALRK